MRTVNHVIAYARKALDLVEGKNADELRDAINGFLAEIEAAERIRDDESPYAWKAGYLTAVLKTIIRRLESLR